MREAIISIGLVMATLSLIICYSALVVASDCDDWEEDYWRKKKDGKES